MKCSTCGGELEPRHYVHEEDVGGVVVTDGTASMPTCVSCGEVLISAKDLTMYELRAAALVLRDGRRVNGEVLRYARKALGLRQSDLGRLLERGPEWISRWETGATMAVRTDQLAMVALLNEAWMRLCGGGELRAEQPAQPDEPLQVTPLPDPLRACG